MALHALLCAVLAGALLVPAARAQNPPSPAAAASVQRLADIPYGSHPRQRMDLYLPTPATATGTGTGTGAPVILMVHGGAWSMGDKARGGVVQEKVARWVPQGLVLVSVNYRLLPGANVLQQAQDVAAALAAIQGQAARWGADASRVLLMGHSAGAHLVALVSASPALARQAGARPWLGTVALDSAALDVPAVMAAPHPAFYDRVFGPDPAFWQAASPLHALADAAPPPFLLVCSTQRSDGSCPQAQAMARRVQALGGRAEVLPQALNHGQINGELGRESDYTRAVEAFMASLDSVVAQALGR